MYRLLASVLLLPLLVLGGCQTPRAPDAEAPRPTAVVEPEEIEEWRTIASPADAQSLDTLAESWAEALADARRRYRRAVAAEGPLLAPDLREPRAAPTPGTYRCRAIRLGARSPRVPAWSVSREGFCYIGVEDDQLSFASEIPGSRIGGYLWDVKEQDRLVFLGATVPARAKTAPPYGETPGLDWAGLLERTEDFTFRLSLPRREGEARLVVIELIAAPDA